jgi:transposase
MKEFKPKQKKGRPFEERPDQKTLKKLYVKEEKSIREIAGLFGYSKDIVYRALQEYGIERRPRDKRSRLRTYALSFLKREVKTKGFRQVARELKINEWTLRAYMKSTLTKANSF